jgi:membrane-associated two-gene conflict system component 1 (EACC1)
VPVAVQLRLECESTEDVESLHRWLRHEQAVRVDGALSRDTADDPEAMGVLLDVLTLIIGSGLSAGQLALAVASWRDSRKPAPKVVITHTAADGAVTRIEAADRPALAAALAELEQQQVSHD